MKLDKKMIVLLAVAVAVPQLSAQEAGKASKPAAGGAHAPIAPAPFRLEASQILLHVTGLTKDNQAAVREALSGLGAQVYVCPDCKHEQATPGKCATCKVDLQSLKRQDFSSVALMPETSTISLTPAQRSMAKLSEIESTLARSSVHVDESRLTLPGSATLVIGGATADGVTAVEKALRDSRLFEAVSSRFDAPRNEIEVQVRAGTTAPLRSAVVKAIEGASPKARLDDVVWERRAGRA